MAWRNRTFFLIIQKSIAVELLVLCVSVTKRLETQIPLAFLLCNYLKVVRQLLGLYIKAGRKNSSFYQENKFFLETYLL